MRAVKYIFFGMIFIIILSFNTINIFAFSPEKLEEEIDLNTLIDTLPESSKEYLPQNLKNTDDLINEIQKTDTGSIFTIFLNILKNTFPSTAKKLYSLLGILIALSVVNILKDNIGTPAYSKGLALLTTAIISIFIYEFLNDIWKDAESYISTINAFITALIPVMTFLYTMGGNVSTAIVNSSGLAILLTFSNSVLNSCMLPLSKIWVGLTIAGNIGNLKGVSEITKTLKGFFTITLSGIMTLFSIFLLFKTNLSASADSAATRTIKFAGSFIPVIGSALGETVRSLMTGISLIKSSVGFLGIIIIFIITLPIFLKILSAKICIDLSVVVSSLLGCERESIFLKEISGIINFVLAINFTTSLMFVFELIVFVIISPALGAA